MKITFLLGNGFDINVGLKTSYRNFYEYYKTIETTDKDVNDVKSAINSGIEDWSDLELALGEYTKNIDSVESVLKIRRDLFRNLIEYLELEQEKFDLSEKKIDQYFDDLLCPERYLTQRRLTDFNAWKNSIKNSPDELRIFTFNYTNVAQKLLGNVRLNNNIKSNNGRSSTLRAFEHIHGSLTSRPVLGVNDVSQLSNKDFHTSQTVLNAIVKPIQNEVLEHTRDGYCLSQISNSNLICIFGSSIGKTDKIWWNKIAESLGPDCRLILFHFCEPIDVVDSYREVEERQSAINIFLQTAEVDEDQSETASKCIDVAVNSSMFDLGSINGNR